MNLKRTAALMLIVLLSIIVVTPIAFTNMANANFCFPPTNPNITFNSPVNTTYTVNDVFLNVRISTYLTGWYGGPRDESLTHLEYSIDGNKFQPLNITNAITDGNPGNTAQFNCSISLHQLSEGNHTLTVKAALEYYEYRPNENLLHTKSISNAYLVIDAIPDNTPTPNTTISPSEFVIPIIAAIAIIAVFVSVYILRIKR